MRHMRTGRTGVVSVFTRHVDSIRGSVLDTVLHITPGTRQQGHANPCDKHTERRIEVTLQIRAHTKAHNTSAHRRDTQGPSNATERMRTHHDSTRLYAVLEAVAIHSTEYPSAVVASASAPVIAAANLSAPKQYPCQDTTDRPIAKLTAANARIPAVRARNQ